MPPVKIKVQPITHLFLSKTEIKYFWIKDLKNVAQCEIIEKVFYIPASYSHKCEQGLLSLGPVPHKKAILFGLTNSKETQT